MYKHFSLTLLFLCLLGQWAQAMLDPAFEFQAVTLQIKQNNFYVRGFDVNESSSGKLYQWQTSTNEAQFIILPSDENNWYRIYHIASDRFVTTSDVSVNGLVSLDDEYPSGNSNQKFKFVKQSQADTYKIHSKHSSGGKVLVLSIPDGNTTEFVSIRLMKNDNAGVESHQKFVLNSLAATDLTYGAFWNQATIMGKDVHLTIKSTFSLLGDVNGVPRQLPQANYSNPGTFVIEDAADDGKWWTPDERFFVIKNYSSGQYLTVTGTTSGSPVIFDDRPDSGNFWFSQQFRLVAAPSGSGWYKFRSRLGNLVLEVRSDGSLVVGTPTAALPTNRRQKFGINLHVPNDPTVSYSLVGKQHKDYLTDHGEISADGQVPVFRTRIANPATQWNFIKLSNGYFKIQNALTKQFLVNIDTNHPAGTLTESRTNYNDSNYFHQWSVERKQDHFIIRSRYQADNNAAKQLLGTPPLSEKIVFQDVTQANTRWLFFRSQYDPISLNEAPLDDIADAPLPEDCLIFFGPSFKRGLAERVGLPADEVYFPFIIDALAYETGLTGYDLTAYIERIDLNNIGHRAYLALAVRNYVADELAYRDPTTWTNSDQLAIDYYEGRIEANREAYAQRIDAAWAEFINITNANGTATTSTLLKNLDVNDFKWPAKFPLTSQQVPYFSDYLTAAANRGQQYKLLSSGSELSIGAIGGLATGIALDILFRNVVSGAVKGALTTQMFAHVSDDVLFAVIKSAKSILGSVFATAGSVLTVVVVATQVLVENVINTIEVQELESDKNAAQTWALQAIDLHTIVTGTNLVEKIQLLEDLDYIISVPAPNTVLLGVPVFEGYLNTQNDNLYQQPSYAITCLPQSVTLGTNGQGQLTWTDIADLITETGTSCGSDFTYTLGQTNFNCDDAGTAYIQFTASNDRISRSCFMLVTVTDAAAPTALCQNRTYYLDTNGQATLFIDDIDNGSFDDCGIVDRNLSGVPIGGLDCDDMGTYTATLTVKDASNQSASCTATVQVVDNFIPSVSCQSAIVQLDASGQGYLAAQSLEQSSYDNCGIVSWKVGAGQDGIDYGCSDVGMHSVMLTVTDPSGNSADCVAQVTVEDKVAPIAQCQPYTVYLNNQGAGMVTPANLDNGSSDACGIQLYELLEANSPTGALVFDCADVMVHTVTLQVTDFNGNSSTCQAQVFVLDIIPPTVTCHDHTLVFNGEPDFTLTTDELVSRFDNCDIVSTDLSRTSFGCAELGSTIAVLATVTDEHGNSSNCTSYVTLEGLPCGWSQTPDGVGCANGNDVAYDVPTDTWTLNSTNCYYTPYSGEEMAFAKIDFCGNGELIAQVQNITGNGWAGITLRENDQPGARYVQISLNHGTFLRREMRTAPNGPITIQQSPAFGKRWLKLVRTGNQITGYLSANGQHWQMAMAANLSLPTCLDAGLMVTNTGAISTVVGTFAGVSVTSQTDQSIVVDGLPTPQAATEDPASLSVELFPNPTAGLTRLRVGTEWGDAVQLEVVNAWGQVLQQRRFSALDGSTQELDLSDLPAGIYHLLLRNSTGLRRTERVVVQR